MQQDILPLHVPRERGRDGGRMGEKSMRSERKRVGEKKRDGREIECTGREGEERKRKRGRKKRGKDSE